MRARRWVAVVATALVGLGSATAQAETGTGVPGERSAAVPAGRSAASSSSGDGTAGALHVLAARRLLDTRSGLGAAPGPRDGGSTISLTVTDRGGVPASGVGAVVLHVTVTGATGSGHVTVYPGGSALPAASTLNTVPGQNVTNMTVVPVGASGTVDLRYTGSGTVHLVADVAGWTGAGTASEPGTTGTLAPFRLMDTRTGVGGRTGALPSGGLAHLQVTGRGGVPASAGSVTLNVTVVAPTRAGWLAVTPVDPGAGKVTTSSVNFEAGRTVANAVTTALSPTGGVDLRLSSAPSAHVVVDVVAWTVPGAPSVAGSLTAQAPRRILDTRDLGGLPTTGAALEVSTGGTGGVVLNVTAVGAARAGHVTVAGSGAGTPNVSQLSFPATSARAALVYVPGTTGGQVRLTLPSSGTHLVVDEVATISGPLLDGSTPVAVSGAAGAEGTSTGTRVTWAPPAGTASVVVRRTTAQAPRSPFDGTSVFSGPGGTTGFDDLTAQPWSTYQYAVFARDALGNYAEAAHTEATGKPLQWSAGTTANPFRGSPQDVSCPTATWCMAVDLSGQALTWNGTAWSSPVRAAEPLEGQRWAGMRSVSCPTTTFCLASLYSARIAVWSAGTWSVSDAPWDLGDVSCWSASACAFAVESGLGSPYDIVRWSSGAFTGGQDFAWGTGGTLSCPTSTCVLGRVNGSRETTVYRVSGSTVTSKRLSSTDWEHPSVSCTSATWCMVTTSDQFATMSGTTWSALRDLEQENGEDVNHPDVSCASPTSCVAVGFAHTGYGAARWNGSTWTIRSLGVGANTQRHVDCATTSACMVVDARGRFNRWTGSAWTARATFDQTRGGIEDLDCSGASDCLATDWFGNALAWSGGASWSLSAIAENRTALDCAGVMCLTVDPLEGTWRARRDGVWGPTTESGAASPGDALLCASASRCFSLVGNLAYSFDGARWGIEPTTLPVNLGDSYTIVGDCPTSTFCLAVDSITRASVTWNGSRWTSRGRIPVDSDAWTTVDCLSPTFCMAKGGDRTSVFTGSSWQASDPITFGGGDVACRTTSHCLAVSNGTLSTWDGTQWSDTSQKFDVDGEVDLTCVGTSRCVLAVGERVWWTL